MMEPSVAWVYPPIAGPGNTVRGAVAAPYTSRWVEQVRKVLTTGVVDTDWLRQQGVSVLYALPGRQRHTQLKNNELLEVRTGVYLIPSGED